MRAVNELAVGTAIAGRSSVSVTSRTTPMSANSISRIEDQVLQYLVSHPNAQDTLEGITTWWLPEAGVPHGASDVEAALAHLVSLSWIRRQLSTDSQAHYSVNPQRMEDIKIHLQLSAEGNTNED